MLVVVSDLHLTDGTNSATIPAAAFHLFANRLREQALRASWRSGGDYRPIEQLDIVLLGDVLDLMRSSRWLASDTRPWEPADSAAASQTADSIVQAILEHNQQGLRVLRDLAAGALRLGAPGQPAAAMAPDEGQSVNVQIHYMVGNTDWLLHLPQARFDVVRQRVVEQLGLANPWEQPFPHDPLDSELLLHTLRRHRVVARHGDVFDPLSFSEDRAASSIADALSIELLGRYATQIEQTVGDDLPARMLAALRDMYDLRPQLAVPAWLDQIAAREEVRPAVAKKLRQTWDERVDDLLQLPLLREQARRCPHPIIDGLERALKFSQRLAHGWAQQTSRWYHQLCGARDNSLSVRALAEQDFRNRRARHIVYGHTHQHETVPLDASHADGYVLDQVYFNTGSWRRSYVPTQCVVSHGEFVPCDHLAYVTFFHGDEQGGCAYESWSGVQAVGGLEAMRHRVDAGRPQLWAAPSISSKRAPRGPHFRESAPAVRERSDS